MLGWWSLSGKGDKDLDEYDAGEEMDTLESLVCCSQGALDNCVNYLGTSGSYILFL